jgi:hypothetical protein
MAETENRVGWRYEKRLRIPSADPMCKLIGGRLDLPLD